MRFYEQKITRAEALKVSALGIAGLYLSACGSDSDAEGSSPGEATTMAWLTWSDHYNDRELRALKDATGIDLKPQLITDNATTITRLRQDAGQWDSASADALWVPAMVEEGVTESFDLDEISTSSQLYSVAREFPWWQDGSNYMAVPFGWATQQLYYDPAHVTTPPDSWTALTDPKYRKRIVLLNAPTDMMAMAGLATGASEPYNMGPDEISAAKDFLAEVKPNVLKLGNNNTDINAALADGSAWIGFNNLGTELLVKDAGGPELEVATPREGVLGFVDGEQLVASSNNKDRFPEMIGHLTDAEVIAQNFLDNSRPLFNEAAYKILVDQGHQEQADRYFYNEPERAAEMLQKGPAEDEQAYTDAFNEVFGA